MNNSRILTIKNAKLSGYYFYINLNKWGDFQIFISIPLKQEKHVKPASSTAPLSPFINNAGLLCVGGRLKAANIPPNSKHQMLISKHHPQPNY